MAYVHLFIHVYMSIFTSRYLQSSCALWFDGAAGVSQAQRGGEGYGGLSVQMQLCKVELRPLTGMQKSSQIMLIMENI